MPRSSVRNARVYVNDSVIRSNGVGVAAAIVDADIMLDRVRVEENATNGVWIVAGPRLHIRDSVIERNAGVGVNADSVGTLSASSMSVTIERSTIRRNATDIRIFARPENPAARLAATISNTVVSENAGTGIEVNCLDVSVGVATIADSTISGNGADGISGTGAGCTLSASHNVIAGNGGTSMVNSSAGSFGTFSDNRVRSNGTDIPSGTLTAIVLR